MGKSFPASRIKPAASSFRLRCWTERSRLRALGDHQAMNALPCIMAAKACEIQDESIQKGLAELEMTKMRTALTQLGAARVLDDSYKSNPESARAAIDTLMAIDGKKHVAVLGDMLDLGRQETSCTGKLARTRAKKASTCCTRSDRFQNTPRRRLDRAERGLKQRKLWIICLRCSKTML